MTIHLGDVAERADWLSCLSAAASAFVVSGPPSKDDAARRIAELADRLFEEYRRRVVG